MVEAKSSSAGVVSSPSSTITDGVGGDVMSADVSTIRSVDDPTDSFCADAVVRGSPLRCNIIWRGDFQRVHVSFVFFIVQSTPFVNYLIHVIAPIYTRDKVHGILLTYLLRIYPNPVQRQRT